VRSIGQEVHLGLKGPRQGLSGFADLADHTNRRVCERRSYQDQPADEHNQEHARDAGDLFHAL
jgi:hypothetical protein